MIAELVTVVYYDCAVAEPSEPYETIANRLWAFCLAALGGHPAP
jgi:hypothetical protein